MIGPDVEHTTSTINRTTWTSVIPIHYRNGPNRGRPWNLRRGATSHRTRKPARNPGSAAASGKFHCYRNKSVSVSDDTSLADGVHHGAYDVRRSVQFA